MLLIPIIPVHGCVNAIFNHANCRLGGALCRLHQRLFFVFAEPACHIVSDMEFAVTPDADADSGMSSVDSWLVVIADAAKMEEKHASLAGIENEVEYASALQIRIALVLPDLHQHSCGSHSATHGRNHKPGRRKGIFSGLRNELRKVMTVRDFKFAFLIAS